MPELPEVEAWRRQLDLDVKRHPIDKAGPAHIATLKTFDPPLTALEGEAFAGARRRAKRLFFPTDDGELALLVHLMSAGRLRYLRAGEKGPKTPAFRLRFTDGGELVLTEGGPKKRAGVWLLRLHSLLRDQRLIAGIGRAWANEILWSARLSPYALSTQLTSGEVERLATAIREEMARGLELRLAGASDTKTYRVHKKLGEPCPRCNTPLAQVDFDEHTIFYCPECQTEGRVLKDRRLSRLLR
jgi:formamidopyrimidine-DNA glycosylase